MSSRARARAVRRRRLVALGVLVAVGVAIWLGVSGGGGKRKAPAAAVRDPDPIAAVESGLLPWRLPVAVSREVVLPGRGNQMVVMTAPQAVQKAVSTAVDVPH